jgi:hypothetical protein
MLINGTKKDKNEEEEYLLTLLQLVSHKLYERFQTLGKAFRALDTDHTMGISLTEFAQAIEHLRLKISFDDIKKLFMYMDSDGSGEIGYDEFTMLTEEKWRKLDPYKYLQEGQKNYATGGCESSHVSTFDAEHMKGLTTDVDKIERLEILG